MHAALIIQYTKRQVCPHISFFHQATHSKGHHDQYEEEGEELLFNAEFNIHLKFLKSKFISKAFDFVSSQYEYNNANYAIIYGNI